MNEFNNRIDLQREVIKIVNSRGFNFQITGLSQGAINRWLMDNKLDSQSDLTKHIILISEKLFFLATKSQEQITNNYKKLSADISKLVEELRIIKY